MAGLATMTLSTSSVRAEETTAQSSYPLKLENAIPLGDLSEYLSWAYTAVPPRTASTAVAFAIASLLLRFMAVPLLSVVDTFLFARAARRCAENRTSTTLGGYPARGCPSGSGAGAGAGYAALTSAGPGSFMLNTIA